MCSPHNTGFRAIQTKPLCGLQSWHQNTNCFFKVKRKIKVYVYLRKIFLFHICNILRDALENFRVVFVVNLSPSLKLSECLRILNYNNFIFLYFLQIHLHLMVRLKIREYLTLHTYTRHANHRR